MVNRITVTVDYVAFLFICTPAGQIEDYIMVWLKYLSIAERVGPDAMSLARPIQVLLFGEVGALLNWFKPSSKIFY